MALGEVMIEISMARVYRGYILGFHQPALGLEIDVTDASEFERRLAQLQAALRPLLPPEARSLLAGNPAGPDAIHRDGDIFTGLLNAIEFGAGLPITSRRQGPMTVPERRKVRDGGLVIRYVLESAAPGFLAAASAFLVDAIRKPANDAVGLTAEASAPAELGEAFDTLMARAPQGAWGATNPRHLARAAADLDLPVTTLPGGLLLFGWGRRSRLTLSTFVETTPLISTRVARDKLITQEFLRLAGVPVPQQRPVGSLDAAKQAAAEIGYPVIVKPRDLDGGQGVTTHIRDEAELAAAVAMALEQSSSLLIERHITGDEFRLLIVGGRLVSVHCREPAYVTGNGRDSVARLVEAENAARRARPSTGFSDAQIELGEDAERMLTAQDLTIGSVPESGRRVRMTTVPKVRTGGALRTVDNAAIHPDTLDMVTHAVRVLRLDVAGVDMITPDPGKPLEAAGGAITEVNASPQITRVADRDLHRQFLEEALGEAGRLPAALIIDDSPSATEFALRIAGRLSDGALGLIHDCDGPMPKLPDGLVAAVGTDRIKGLLMDRRVGAVLVSLPLRSIVAQGLPLDRFDVVALRRGPVEQAISHIASPLVRPHLRGPVLLRDGKSLPKPALAALSGVGLRRFSVDDDLIDTLLRFWPGRLSEPRRETGT